MHKTRISIVLTAAVLLLASCDKASDVSGDLYKGRDVSALKDPAILQYIPADTPFVMVSYKPLPSEIVDVFADMFEPLAASMEEIIQNEMADSGEQGRVLAKELKGKMNRKGFESLGFTVQPRFAMYAVGASLVMRMDIKDGNKVSALVDRIEAVEPFRMQKQTLGNVTYRRLQDNDADIVVAITKNEIILAIASAKSMDDVLPIVFLQKKPSKSLANSGELRKAIGKYGFAGIMTGFFDSHKLADFFTGDASKLTQKTMADSGLDLSNVSPACKKDLHKLADIAPRMLFGYTKVSKKQLETLMVFELRKDIAAELQTLQTQVPGLSTLRKQNAVFAMGLGVDFKKAMAFADQKASAIKKQPYQCELLASLNDLASEVAGDLASTDVPFVSGAKGGLIVATDVTIGGIMPSGKGYGLIAIDKPMDLVNMAKGQVPGMDNTVIKADGKPVKLSLPIPLAEALHVAVKDNNIAFSMGEDGKKSMVALINSKPTKGGPFFVTSYDMGKYFELMDGFISSFGHAEKNFLSSMSKHMGVVTYELHATDEGVIARYEMTFR